VLFDDREAPVPSTYALNRTEHEDVEIPALVLADRNFYRKFRRHTPITPTSPTAARIRVDGSGTAASAM
jgi:hypothetical protein